MIDDLLIVTLETSGLSVWRQGSLPESVEYPDRFYTYWLNYSDGSSYYDNAEALTEWDFDVYCYASNPQAMADAVETGMSLLKAAGFIIGGRGWDVASDQKTHTGRGFSATYLENRSIK